MKERQMERERKQGRASKKIRKGDKVIVISGNNRGQSGIVLSCQGERAVVEGLNIRKKHVKRTEASSKGRIIDVECPLHISNLQVCTEDNLPVKLKARTNTEGEKELFYINEGEEVLYRSIKKPK